MGRWIGMPLVGFDTETTGLSVTEDRIFEIALVTFQGGEPVDPYAVLLDPMRPLSEASREKTGLRDEDLQGRPVFQTLAPEIADRIRGQVLVGYNVLDYDLPLLRAELARVGMEVPPCHVVDVLVLARGLGLKDDQGRRIRLRLEDVVRFFEVPMGTAHRATADAEATVRLLYAMASRLPEELEDLLNLQAQWQAQQRAERSRWRGRGEGDGDREALLRTGTAATVLRDGEGRVSLGPSYLYGRDPDPLRAVLRAWFDTMEASGKGPGRGGANGTEK
ncbi:3'-5' exonuclease [Myxococcota bacterium]|nr:3'-5' exonuclease [Myxococcota bacterium]